MAAPLTPDPSPEADFRPQFAPLFRLAPGLELILASASPRRRIAAIPHEEVLAFERGGRALERRRHEQFAGHRYPGTEWFAVHPALLEHVEGLRAGVDDPWAQYGRWLSRALALRA